MILFIYIFKILKYFNLATIIIITFIIVSSNSNYSPITWESNRIFKIFKIYITIKSTNNIILLIYIF